MNNPTIRGMAAVKVNAKIVTWGVTSKAKLYDIDGDEKWIPNSLCKFEREPGYNGQKGNTPGVLTIQEWFYNKIFPNK